MASTHSALSAPAFLSSPYDPYDHFVAPSVGPGPGGGPVLVDTTSHHHHWDSGIWGGVTAVQVIYFFKLGCLLFEQKLPLQRPSVEVTITRDPISRPLSTLWDMLTG